MDRLPASDRVKRALGVLRDAEWLHAGRVKAYARLIVLSAPIFLVLCHVLGLTNGGDFVAFWTAGKLAASGQHALVYDTPAFLGFQASLGFPPDRPFISPLPYLAVVSGLGLLPYATAFSVFMAATYLGYAAALRWLPTTVYWPALAFPAGITCAIGGQTGFLTAALLFGACGLLPRHKLVAGLLIGLLIVKPQLAILTPFALAAGREWRAFASAAVTVILALALSTLWFGPATLQAYIDQASFTGGLLDGLNEISSKVQSVLVAAYAVGVFGPAAWALQAAASVGAACAVWVVWRRTADPLTRAAALGAAVPLATPYLFVYDLPVLVAPVAWLTVHALTRGLRPWQRLGLLALWFAPAAMVVTAGAFPLTPFLAAGLLLAVVRDARAPLAPTRTAGEVAAAEDSAQL